MIGLCQGQVRDTPVPEACAQVLVFGVRSGPVAEREKGGEMNH
jgi:hypothetical protein